MIMTATEEDRIADSSEIVRGGLSGREEHRSALDVRGTIPPWFVWPLFFASILGGAASGPITRSMHGAAPFALAGWRHQVTALALLPGFIWQWTQFCKSDQKRKLQCPGTVGLVAVASIGLSAHAGSYIWSLDHTSMPHCLFLTAMSPIGVAIFTKLAGRKLLKGEMGGVSLGILGAAILAAGTRVEVDNETTLVGDLAALFSAMCFATYLTAGCILRGWMPLFVYQFPVALAASFILAGAAAFAEMMNWSEGEVSGPFGWISQEYLLGTLFLGIISGVVGHAGSSTVLRYARPIIVTTGQSLQPILGTILGWAIGESSVPGLWTCLGGLVTLSGTLCASYAKDDNKESCPAKHERLAEEYRQPAELAEDEEGHQGTKPLLQPSEIP